MSIETVVFRRWKDTGDIIALFPEIPADLLGHYCLSYEHICQHGAANFERVMRHSKDVSPVESAGLARELALLGYDLKPIRRVSHRHHKLRRQMAERLREDSRTNTDQSFGTEMEKT
jgi:hypothetical protein